MRLKLYRERDRVSTIFLKSSNKIAVHVTLQAIKTRDRHCISGKLLTKDLDPGIYFFLASRYDHFSKKGRGCILDTTSGELPPRSALIRGSGSS